MRGLRGDEPVLVYVQGHAFAFERGIVGDANCATCGTPWPDAETIAREGERPVLRFDECPQPTAIPEPEAEPVEYRSMPQPEPHDECIENGICIGRNPACPTTCALTGKPLPAGFYS